MRLHQVREFLSAKDGTDDVSERFGLSTGSVSAAEVTMLIVGHDDMESLERTVDGSRLVVRDRRDWKFGTFQSHR